MRNSGRLAYGLIAVVAWLIGAQSAMAAGETAFFPLSPATHAVSLAAGPEDGVWFSGAHARPETTALDGVIGRVGGDGLASEFGALPKKQMGKIVEGADGNLWFAVGHQNRRFLSVPRIGRVSPVGEFNEYHLVNHVGSVRSIAAGADGNLWFTMTYFSYRRPHHTIGRITTSGALTWFPLPSHSYPGAIVAGPDSNLWFTESSRAQPAIGRITYLGKVTHFPLRRRGGIPRSITVGPDENLWFTEGHLGNERHPKNRIGRITTSGAITEFTVPGKNGTEAIAAGPAGNIWFVTRNGHRATIDSITPAGTVARPTCLEATCELVPKTLAVGPGGALWFAAGKEAWGYGGSSTFFANFLIAHEAGFVGKFSPPPQTIATDR